jgi:hypothetical protein
MRFIGLLGRFRYIDFHSLLCNVDGDVSMLMLRNVSYKAFSFLIFVTVLYFAI